MRRVWHGGAVPITDLPPLHEDMTFLSPLSEERAARLVRWLSDGLVEGGVVVDAGCGWGELLVRVVEAAPLARGIGVDLEQGRIDEARRRADLRRVGARTTFTAGDAATMPGVPPDVDAVIAIGASQVWGTAPSEGDGPLDYAAALDALRSAVRRGGRVLYGEAIWSRPPTPEATAPLSGRDDELVSLADLVDLCGRHGFAVVGVHETTLDEWDEFETGFTAGWARWLADHHPDHPDAPEVRDRLASQQEGYFRGYRGVLGLVYLELLALERAAPPPQDRSLPSPA
jgi:hypothetical protein